MLQTASFILLGIFSIAFLTETTFKLIRFLSIQYVTLEDSEDSQILLLLFIDLLLLVLFMLQHSFMSSKTIKKDLWPACKPAYRTLYTVATCVTLQLMIYYWQRVDVSLWYITTEDAPMTSLFFILVHIFSWTILFLENTLTEPLCLIGIKQLFYNIMGYKSPKRNFSRQFQELLNHMPHPGTVCFMMILWVCPVMTLDRWLLSTVLTMYMCLEYSVTHQDYSYTVKQIQTAQYVTLSKSSSSCIMEDNSEIIE